MYVYICKIKVEFLKNEPSWQKVFNLLSNTKACSLCKIYSLSEDYGLIEIIIKEKK